MTEYNILNDTVKQSTDIYFVVEQMPQYPGGQAELRKFISSNLKYPKIEQETPMSGRVIVSFVIDVDGSVVDAKVVKSMHPLVDKEVLRVIKLLPKWTPGKQDGRLVKVSYQLPIHIDPQ